MAFYAVFLLALCFIASTECQTTATPTSNDVTLTATPSDVTCVFTRVSGSEISSFISLTLSRSQKPAENTFSEVAMVTSFSGGHVDVKDASIGGIATGNISSNGAMINLKWHYPDKAASGNYKCEAFGLDSQGHPVTSADLATIVTESSDLAAAILEIADLKSARNECLTQASEWQNAVWGSFHDANSTEYNVTGHRYFLSQTVKVNVTYTQKICGILGGYLAEIEDQGEYDFIVNFLGSLGTTGYNQEIQVGGSDLASEGSWVFPHSGEAVKFFQWAPSQPSDGDTDDCLNINVKYDYDRYKRIWELNPATSGMVDNCCTGCAVKRFLCEVP